MAPEALKRKGQWKQRERGEKEKRLFSRGIG